MGNAYAARMRSIGVLWDMHRRSIGDPSEILWETQTRSVGYPSEIPWEMHKRSVRYPSEILRDMLTRSILGFIWDPMGEAYAARVRSIESYGICIGDP